MPRSLAYGSLILVATNLVWFLLLELEVNVPGLQLLIWAAPFAASVVASYLAPTSKRVLGLSMIVPAVVFPLIFNAGYALLGNRVDFPGFGGAINLMMIITPFTALLCLLGTTIGWLASGRLRTNKPPRIES